MSVILITHNLAGHNAVLRIVCCQVFIFQLVKQADNTDLRIAERSEEVGGAKGDIVLGFQPLRVQPYTEYALA